MSDRPPTLEEVDQKLSEIDKKLTEYNAIVAEKQTLLEYRSLLVRMGFGSAKPAPGVPSSPQAPSIGGNIETFEIAKKILDSVPQMSESEIVKEAIRRGWSGSGDEAKDRNRFYAAMHRKRDVFQKVPGVASTWRLKRD